MHEIELILGNSNRRFSGVTSTMRQVLSRQKDLIPTAVMGKHYLPENTPTLSFFDAVKLCRKTLPNGSPRIFHARRNDEMIQALVLKKLFGGKLRIAFTSTAQRQHTSFTKWLIRRMDAVITTSAAAASYLDHPPDIIIPHGVDEAVYKPADSKCNAWAQLGFPGKYGIGIFGRVRKQKGIDILIEAAIPVLKHYEDFTVIICGEITPNNQKFAEQLKQLVLEAGLADRILFIGKQPFERLPLLFRSMSIVAAVSRNEGFGLTVLEAMASGTAVVASEAGAWKEIIGDHSFGACVPCGDVHSLRQKLDYFMSQPEQLEALGLKGRQRVLEAHTLEREATKLTNSLRSLSIP